MNSILATPNTTVDTLKQRIAEAYEARHDECVTLARWLYDHPETAWKEFKSSTFLAEFLKKNGFDVQHPYRGLETAFVAVAQAPRGSSSLARSAVPNASVISSQAAAEETRAHTIASKPFTIAFLAEYDALPGLGHACGHHLIAAMSIGAALAARDALHELGADVMVMGTPAEEGGGGKIELLEAGAFEGVDFALMAHPAPVDIVETRPFAVAHWHISFDGRPAHAAAYPERGINANDAMVIAQVALGLLRQQLPSTVRVHGIQTVGGEAPNAIPAHTEARWYIRADTTEEMEITATKVRRCFEAAALATGTQLTITEESRPYREMRTDYPALAMYRANAQALGRDVNDGPSSAEAEAGGASASPSALAGDRSMARASTDMGNVSQVVDAIHPYIGVGGTASNHQPAFAEACTTDLAWQALHDGAIALAWTAIDKFLAQSHNQETELA